MKICYRPHRGAFEDAMKEMRKFPNMGKLIIWVCRQWNDDGRGVEISWYCYDKRLKADCFIVLVGKEHLPVGWCWYDLQGINKTLREHRASQRYKIKGVV